MSTYTEEHIKNKLIQGLNATHVVCTLYFLLLSYCQSVKLLNL